jgi:hypothetical protein
VNSSFTDYISDSGARISTPIYYDASPTELKTLYNKVRQVASTPITSSVKSVSGITVDSFGSAQQAVERHLGCSLEVLRTLLFSRGGVNIDLILKIQQVIGEEVVSVKELEAAFKTKLNVVKEILKNYPYTSNELPE